MPILHHYRTPALSEHQTAQLLAEANANAAIKASIKAIRTEYCFNVQVTEDLTAEESERLQWLLRETFEQDQFASKSFLEAQADEKEFVIAEVGPRMSFCTAWSSNAVTICKACGLSKVVRAERSRRYGLVSSEPLSKAELQAFVDSVHDPMTECYYAEPINSFESGAKPAPVFTVPVMEKGRAALEEINNELGLGFDEQDLDFYTDLFRNKIKRDPTSVECFDMAQSNSEHSRHWFFNGDMIIDGEKKPETLFKLVKKPWKVNPSNSTVAFCDNSSALRGGEINTLVPKQPGQVGPMQEAKVDYDITFTAETHNFPCGVAPFPGAETGTGGRLRDQHSTGVGSLVVAGTAAYCVGNLHIPGYEQPWEDKDFKYPANLASPLQIITDASNGASDYGNKFGEPLIQGYTRSFGQRLPNGERREWVKPIMFSGGVGQMDKDHVKKGVPEPKMLCVKLGGPAYRIGMGGGAASSMVQGDNKAELDFNAVQRGDAEMEQKTNRVIRACVEMGKDNPIVSIHDQGAGGNGNVLKELVEPAGAVIQIRDVLCGDKTMSVLELWGAEFQENDALLLRPEHRELFDAICKRENAPYSVVGVVTGDGRVVVHDSEDGTNPVDLELEHILSGLPSKTFVSNTQKPVLRPLSLPEDVTVEQCCQRVLRLLSVSSKRFLTSKVDRSVTGLIAQQQCVGPLQITLADCAVVAQSHLGVTGAATSVGEQPIKGLLNAGAMARMTVGEALTNLVWAKCTALEHVKCSGNWMWAAKFEGEGSAMYSAAEAMSKIMIELGIAIDGGKDSLSMAARVPKGDAGESEMAKCPGELVVSCYVTCPDVRLTVTPDLKRPGDGVLLLVRLSDHMRMGGSALAQVFNQLGETSPDVEDAEALKAAFNAVQELIGAKLITAGHDRSDGGLLTTVLEMAFAGNCGVELDLQCESVKSVGDAVRALFHEELGLVMEVREADQERVMAVLAEHKVKCDVIGRSRQDAQVKVSVNGQSYLKGDVRDLRDMWEETSFQLERRQTTPALAEEEQRGLRARVGPQYKVTYDCKPTPDLGQAPRHKVAIIRQEGSNGDREMCSAFHAAGFEAWDVHMNDLLEGKVKLEDFRGVAFVGGFSYADVLDSAKGWAATIKYNKDLSAAFQAFYDRKDTFSLGVCNGCQLMALMGWVPYKGTADALQPRFIHNKSGRFESRFSTVVIEDSPAVMFDGMAGSSLGVWIAHGEGQAYFPQADMLDKVVAGNLAPLRYANDANEPTTEYPANPNGSPFGIAALCSEDGRHLAMMPHPERVFLKWQWPYMPESFDALEASPWLRLFQNARRWCDKN